MNIFNFSWLKSTFLLLLPSLFLAMNPNSALGSDSPEQERARLMVHLLDYLAKDYGGAVANGVVISEGEYAEQVEFVSEVVKASEAISELKGQTTLLADLVSLKEMILTKASADTVAAKARSLQVMVVKATSLPVAPAVWPRVDAAVDVFSSQCASCHGQFGSGDGVAGAGLDPKPANFHETERMASASPMGLYNTIRMGVPGTGMPAFAALTDDQAWSLAFYLQSLRFRLPRSGTAVVSDPAKAVTALQAAAISLKDLATSTDAQLGERLAGKVDQPALQVEQIRLYDGAPGNDELAAGTTSGMGLPSDGELAKKLLQDAEVAFEKGDRAGAKTMALRAYLEGIEPLEPKLRALDPALVVTIEADMAEVRRVINDKGDLGVLKAAIANASATLSKIAPADGSSGGLSPALAFSAASAIILREGFEAVLIVIALLSVIRAAGAPVAALYVHGGWIGALGVGAGLWFLSGWLMVLSGAGREALEGFTSLLAVVILLVVGFWLHNQTEIGRWKRFINGKVRDALQGGRVWTLFTISFIAVFREAIEVVLFIRAIWLDSGAAAKWAVLSGVGLSLAAVILISWLILRFSVRMPIKALFSASSFIMAILALVLTGKGFHALQETGLVSETGATQLPRLDFLGIFPTWETVVSQLVMLVFVLTLWFFGRRPTIRGRASAV